MIADIVAPQGVRTPQGVDPGTEISFKVVAGADTITFTLASDSTVTAPLRERHRKRTFIRMRYARTR